ncbi:hypothetical protein E2C01_084524 [Portunus trituberculatus]|uniref:Uncharacterized protein n=1 Tax=Portunus trituberculatus TaxID=210409 RepID=A0A5B7IYI0_PORTR|nr:hypothetical protein [Portunus trituberculatus]
MRNTAPCTPSRPVNYLSSMMDGRPLRNAAHLPPIAADRRLQPTGRAMLRAVEPVGVRVLPVMQS